MARKKSKVNKASVAVEDSDDGGSGPDPTDDSYYQDEVDEYHLQQEKILLEKGAAMPKDVDESDEEEVLGFDDDSSGNDEEYQDMKQRLQQLRRHGVREKLASDLEDDEEDDKPGDDGEKAWGSSKYQFYGGHDSDVDEELSGSEPEAAALEEQEALAIQRRLLESIDDEDAGLDLFKAKDVTASEIEGEKIVKDLSSLSRREKMTLLKKQSPELLELLDDYKIRKEELTSRLMPVFTLVRENRLPANSPGAKLIQTQTRLYLNYLVNLTFYLMLKAKQESVENHPIIRRLLQYRKLMKQLDALEPRIKPHLDAVLKRIRSGEKFEVLKQTSVLPVVPPAGLLQSKKRLDQKDAVKKRQSKEVTEEEPEEVMMEGGRSWGRKRSKHEAEKPGDANVGETEDLAADDEEMERRGINYQIEKNKGLTVQKRKELRNPRVKNKLKYKKALHRRKGQVREVRTEMQRYGGEVSGIRAAIKRSVKFKN